ncbi:response regulator [Devosia aquimaris]|uniref:response regulator n=1 Tax=Devosia aquimaris TaxID=2866214 RepID=UPI001CD14AF4|nr:response regulator [Devosia sp. CJK-A8-3]
MRNDFRVLIIDDSEAKRRRVMERLAETTAPFNLAFVEAGNYEEACARLSEQVFDFVVLDIMLPAGNGEPHPRWSRILIEKIASGTLSTPVNIFGLTEYEDMAEQEKLFFEENLFGLSVFNWNEDGWANFIGAKIRFIATAIHTSLSFQMSNFDFDFLVLTARHDSEYLPIRNVLFGETKSSRHPVWREASHFGAIHTQSGRSFKTALVCVGEMGLAGTAAIAAQAIQFLRPRVVAMLGMCAGFEGKGCNLLDCIVATEAACWQDGKHSRDDGKSVFDDRGKNRNCSPGSRAVIDEMIERYDDSFAELMSSKAKLPRFRSLKKALGSDVGDVPRVRSGLVLSGSSIVADEDLRRSIEARHATAVGLEMEIYALYTAAYRSMGRPPQYFAIKGIADFADGSKKDKAQTFASELSASVFLRIVEMRGEDLISEDGARRAMPGLVGR